VSECEHKWEDAQLRATKDGAYILSVDYCPRCGAHDLSYKLLRLEAEVTRLKAKNEELEAELEDLKSGARMVLRYEGKGQPLIDFDIEEEKS
jgi:hypothetical protein